MLDGLMVEFKEEVLANVDGHRTVAVFMSNIFNKKRKMIEKWNLITITAFSTK